MSLRFRLILSIALMLLVTSTMGGVVAWMHARRSVQTEMSAALAVAEHTIGTVLALSPGDGGTRIDMRRLIPAFDGDRHLRARLIDRGGRVTAESSLATPTRPVPDWFARSIDRKPLAARIALPSNATGDEWIILETDSRNEMTEVWGEFADNLEILLLFSVLTFPMIYWVLGRALRPLHRLLAALLSVGSGVSSSRVAEVGPPELSQLAQGFNSMIDRLAIAESKNRRLHEQLMTIQEEERSELARDLHDDVGPYLFAVGVDAAAIRNAAEAMGHAEILNHVRSVRDGIIHVQQQVKAILGRLRPGGVAELGVVRAIENLVAFWRTRYPEIAFTVRLGGDEDHYGTARDAAIYRIVQESLNNAIRHGKPRAVAISVRANPDGSIEVEISDDGVGMELPVGPNSYGLRGMSERIAALGGTFDIRNRGDPSGVIVTARLPASVIEEETPA